MFRFVSSLLRGRIIEGSLLVGPVSRKGEKSFRVTLQTVGVVGCATLAEGRSREGGLRVRDSVVVGTTRTRDT